MDPPLLILDIDETLIYATAAPLHRAADFEVGPYAVYKRPLLTEFLAFAHENFAVAVWSSASSDYVDAIVQRIFPQPADLKFVWSRDRCTRRYSPEWQEEYWLKDLKKVKRAGYSLDRILVVDDTSQKLERNYGNVILVRSFEGDTSDEELRRLMPYLRELLTFADLRSVEKRNWRMSR